MAQHPQARQQAKVFKTRSIRPLEIHYLLFLPREYSAEPAKRWPLILFLHGAGERGTNLISVTKHGPPKLVREKPDFPFILISPQCPSGQRWDNETLIHLLDQVIEDHRVDPRRVYLTGLSMGGYGTWSLGLNYPRRFAAIAPICGGGNAVDVLLPDPRRAAALKSLPVWAFHGAKDPVVPLQETERMVAILKKAGNPNVKLTVYPNAKHDSWTETYNNPALYDWLLEHHRRHQ